MKLRFGFLVLLIAILAGISLLIALPLLQYILAAGLIAFVLFPLHERILGTQLSLGRFTLTIGPRTSAASLTLFAILALVIPLLILTLLLFQTVVAFLEDLGESELLEHIYRFGEEFGLDRDVIDNFLVSTIEQFDEWIDPGVDMLLDQALGWLDTSLRIGIGLLVLVFLLYYFLKDGRQFLDWLADVTPLHDDVRKRLLHEIDVVTWAVLKSHVFVAVLEGLLGGIGLYVLGVPNVAFWTIVMIIVSFLPAIGIWLVWFPAVGYLVMVDQTTAAILLLIYGITVLSVVDNYVRALLVDRDSGVHPAVVLVGVIGGLYLFGILGLFLGPVLLAVFKAVLRVFGEEYGTPDDAEAVVAGSSR